MNHTTKGLATLAALTLGIGLTVGTGALTASAAPSPAVTYETVVWSMPSPNTGTASTYPQQGVSQHKGETSQTLDVQVPATCGTQYQVDVYVQTNYSGEVDNTLALDALFKSGLSGPDSAQDGAYLAGQGNNPGTAGIGHAWKFVKNSDCVTETPPPTAPAVVPCTLTGSTDTESGDVAPVLTDAGLVFNGPTNVGQGRDLYYRVSSGNAQSVTALSVTYGDTSVTYPAQVNIEVWRTGIVGTLYATLSTTLSAAQAVGTVNVMALPTWYTSKIASGPGSLASPESYTALIANYPANKLLSGPSLHLQSNSPASAHSLVTALHSSCGSFSYVKTVTTPPAVTPATPVAPVAPKGIHTGDSPVQTSGLLALLLLVVSTGLGIVALRKRSTV
jgi:hypothetical protein